MEYLVMSCVTDGRRTLQDKKLSLIYLLRTNNQTKKAFDYYFRLDGTLEEKTPTFCG